MRVFDPFRAAHALTVLLVALSALAQQANAQGIDYATTIQPIYDTHCIGCHSTASPNGNLTLESDSYANTVNMSASNFGSYRVRPNFANNTQSAIFNVLVTQGSGANHRGDNWVATAQQKTSLTNWINQGALPDLSAPTVTSLNVTSGARAGGTAVTITGTAFGGRGTFVPVVTFGGVAATNVVVTTGSFTSITCTTPAHASGPVNVVVSTTAGGASAPLMSGFTYLPNTNNNLSNLVPSVGALNTTFSSATTAYTMNVAYAVSTLRLTPTVADSTATVQVDGNAVTSGSASADIPLSVGANIIDTIVSAENGAMRTYRVTVTRGPANPDSNLSNLVPSTGVLNTPFSTGTTNYSMNVVYAVDSIRLTPTVADTLATVQVNGSTVATGTASNAIPLIEGANVIETVVTAESGATQTYTVTVTRAAASTSATLANLVPNSGTLAPTFNFATTSYTLTVPLQTSSFTLTPTLSAGIASVTVDGLPVADGTPSSQIQLNADSITVDVVVTSQDTTATQIYTVTVQRNFAGTPRIVQQPASQIIAPNGAVTFNVAAVGSPTLSYQWRKNGVNIAAATGASYTLASVLTTSSGAYSVVVKNSVGSVTSDSATLTVAKPGITGFPEITTQPLPALVALGSTATFSSTATGNITLTYQWRKAGVAIPLATSASYTTPPTTLTNAGTYSVLVKNAQGSVISTGARLGVVSLANTTKLAKIGTTATLTVSAAGEGLIYQWKKNGEDMSDSTDGPHVVTGTKTASLVIKGTRLADTDSYSCLVRLGAIFCESGAIALKVYDRAPIIQLATNAPLPPGIVSGSYHDGTGNPYAVPVDTSSDRAVVTFTATGLPTGLKIHPTTGVIYGKPTVASKVTASFPNGEPFKVTITATNAVNKDSVLVLLHISPLPVAAVGTFNGLVDRDASLSSGLSLNAAKTFSAGGTLNVTTLGTGVFSGKLILGTLSYPFVTKVLDAEIGANPMATVVITRKLPLTNLTLAFSIDKTTGELAGTVSDGAAPTVTVQAWRNTLQALGLQGAYTAVLDFTAAQTPDPMGDLAYPQGNGFGTLTVTTKGATWSGRLADGTVTTYATTIGSTGQVPLHLMLYTNTGSVHGWMQVTADNVITPTNAGQPLLDGTVDWVKITQASTSTNQNYKSGFALHMLTIAGGKYVKTTPVLGLMDGGLNSTNASLIFSEGGLSGPPPIVGASMAAALNATPFRITSTNTLVMPAAVDNPATLKFTTFSATTGAFTGTCVLKNDPDPTFTPAKIVSRTVNFAGVLVPRVGINKGVGYFLLSKLPELASPNTTLKTSPILSGQIVMGAK